jgi:hypothetical protein
MSWFGGVRRRMPPLLVLALGGAAAALSWDALRSVALTTGAVHHAVMAGVWAVTIDLLWIACMRAAARAMPGRRKWALAGLVVGVGFSGFQVFTPWTWLARMVPVTALLVAWMLDTFVVSKPAPARIVEESDGTRSGPASDDARGPIRGSGPGNPAHAAVDARGDGARVPDDGVHSGHVAGYAQRPGVVADGRGHGGGVEPPAVGQAHDHNRVRSIDATVMRILDARGLNAHQVKRGDIIDEVTREMGPVTVGSVGNALTRLRARQNASSNGGPVGPVRVRWVRKQSSSSRALPSWRW